MREAAADVGAGAGAAGWTLVQLSELVRRAEQLLLDGITLVGPHIHAAMPADATIQLAPAELQRITASLAEGAEIAEQLELLAAHLPADAVDAGYDAVRDAAAADVASGIVDPHRVLLAARVLDAPHGWPALAASLAAGDVVSTWGRLTVGMLLGRFRGVDPETVERVVAAAGLKAGARFSDCPAEALDALADALRRHASEQPAS